MQVTELVPGVANRTLDNTYEYAGSTFTILLSGRDTGGRFAVFEAVHGPGSEPPVHIHDGSDEVFYILEGEANFLIDGIVHRVVAGQSVFMPRGIAHSFRVTSDFMRVIVYISPAGFEEWFPRVGMPTTSFDPPKKVDPPSVVEKEYMMQVGKRLNARLVAWKANI